MSNDKKNSGFESSVVAFLKALFAGESFDGIHFGQLPSAASLRVLIYFFCRQALPEDLQKEAQLTYLQFVAAEMRRRATLDKITELMNNAGIAFYPLKGCELAYRYYPDPVLRYSVDIDFLTSADNALPAFQLLTANGWKPPHEFSNLGGRHFPDLFRKNFCTIEVHRYLFREENDENRRLMQILEDDPHSPELLLVHLMYHAFRQHHWQNAMKTVIDVGMILRKCKIDPDKYRTLASEFYVSGLLETVLASFPDIYPESWRKALPLSQLDDDVKRAIRAFAFTPDDLLHGLSEREMVFLVNRPGFMRFICKQIKSLSPSMLGSVYKLSPAKAFWCYPFFLVHYFVTRSFRLFRFLVKDSKIQKSDLGRVYHDLEKLDYPEEK